MLPAEEQHSLGECATCSTARYARQAAEYGDEASLHGHGNITRAPWERQASGFTLGYELHAYLGKLAEAVQFRLEILSVITELC